MHYSEEGESYEKKKSDLFNNPSYSVVSKIQIMCKVETLYVNITRDLFMRQCVYTQCDIYKFH